MSDITSMGMIKYLDGIEQYHVHGKNLLGKIKKSQGDYTLLVEIFKKYRDWREKSNSVYLEEECAEEEGIKRLVEHLNDYKDFISEKNIYTAQSKFEPTILEEFIAILFRNLVKNTSYSLGGIRAYSNLYFSPTSLSEFENNPSIKVNEKDQDFAIYKKVLIKCLDHEYYLHVPVLSIECKTYLDKTMLEGSIATAEKIKMGNPHCLFLIVTERYEVDINVDPSYSRIDGIFVLRKQGRGRRNYKDPIYYDVVLDLYRMVKRHLTTVWNNIESDIAERGRII